MQNNEWIGVVLILGLLGWIFWPSYDWSSTITVHGYACVQYQDNQWHLADYNKDTCTGSERNIENGRVTFRVFPETQRVVAKNGNGAVLSLDHCSVYDTKNWECSTTSAISSTFWEMGDGDFAGAVGNSENVRYSGVWSWLWRYTNGAPLKDTDVAGL